MLTPDHDVILECIISILFLFFFCYFLSPLIEGMFSHLLIEVVLLTVKEREKGKKSWMILKDVLTLAAGPWVLLMQGMQLGGFSASQSKC